MKRRVFIALLGFGSPHGESVIESAQDQRMTRRRLW